MMISANRALAAVIVAALMACATSKEKADTLLPVDTAKSASEIPNPPAPPAISTKATPADSAPVPASPPATKVSQQKPGDAKPPLQARDTAHLGRDSVIKVDPRDPRRQLPTVPPEKKPPRE